MDTKMRTRTLRPKSCRRRRLAIESLESRLVMSSPDLAPSLGPPPAAGSNVIWVNTDAALQNAITNLQSGQTIVIQKGTYNLSNTLYIGKNHPVTNVTIRGATDNYNDVVLLGQGMDNASYGNVPMGISVYNAQNVTIADLSIGKVYYDPIELKGDVGASQVQIYHTRLFDAGEQFIKADPNASGGGVNNSSVKYSLIEYTAGPPTTDHGGGVGYTNGIDVHAGQNWDIADNLIRNLHTPDSDSGNLWNPAILIWNHSSNVTVERNTIINCDRAIALGLIDQSSGYDNQNGIIRNNFVYMSPGLFSASRQAGADAPVIAWDSPGTKIEHNTIITDGNEPNSIQVRFSSTTGIPVVNNLGDAPVRARDGATYTASGNYWGATAGMFVNPSAGDLHLVSNSATQANVISQVAPVADVKDDWDGAARPLGSNVDIGAAEYHSTTTTTSPTVTSGSPAPNATGVATTAAGATPPPSGLVAAYSFDEGSGTTVADSSGNGNTGTITNATWTTAGKHGNALSFNGTSSMVTIPDAPSLDLTKGMTLEAWVDPTAVSNAWRDVLYKGNGANDNYMLYSSSQPTSFPATGGSFGSSSDVPTFGTAVLPLNTWTHLAATYDGAHVLLYVNGVQVASLAETGNILTSTNPLQIGGDTFNTGGQHFQGLIDDVRIYNQALSQSAIQSDMSTPVGQAAPSTTPTVTSGSPAPNATPLVASAPAAPSNLTATGGNNQIALSWTGSSGATGYNIYRSTSSGGEGSTPYKTGVTGTSWTDTGLTNGTTYYYQVSAVNAVGESGKSTEASAADGPAGTTPPTASTPLAQEPLLNQANLQYVGAFRLPTGQFGPDGNSTFAYGGTAIAFNPAHNSLFVVGHDYGQEVAEVAIPGSIVNSSRTSDLATATVLQPFADVLGRLPSNPLASLNTPTKIGGLQVVGGQLVGSAYAYYDGAGAGMASHFTLDSTNLASAHVAGLFQLGTQGGGYVGGYMAPIPAEWQAALGAPYLTGQSTIPITGRTSLGPAAFGFDPAKLGPGVNPDIPYVYYTLNHPTLGTWENGPPTSYNMNTLINGVAFVPGTRSVLFFGSVGLGSPYYGGPEAANDPNRGGKGPHSVGGQYGWQVWAYDALDFLAVKNGQKNPWDVKPYATWSFSMPEPDGAKLPGGVAFDPATGRLYVSELRADVEGYDVNPLIQVFQVT
jgi:hypothetical protein